MAKARQIVKRLKKSSITLNNRITRSMVRKTDLRCMLEIHEDLDKSGVGHKLKNNNDLVILNASYNGTKTGSPIGSPFLGFTQEECLNTDGGMKTPQKCLKRQHKLNKQFVNLKNDLSLVDNTQDLCDELISVNILLKQTNEELLHLRRDYTKLKKENMSLEKLVLEKVEVIVSLEDKIKKITCKKVSNDAGKKLKYNSRLSLPSFLCPCAGHSFVLEGKSEVLGTGTDTYAVSGVKCPQEDCRVVVAERGDKGGQIGKSEDVGGKGRLLVVTDSHGRKLIFL